MADDYVYQMGSISGTSQAGVNLIDLARDAEKKAHNNLFIYPREKLFVKKMCITTETDCSIKINGGTSIPLISKTPYTVDDILAHSVEITEAGVQYVFDYGY